MFTLHEQPLQPNDRPSVEPLEKAIQRIIQNEGIKIQSPILYCLRLHVNESGHLLKLLNKDGINAASLFPGYAGATQSLKEIRLYKGA